MSKQIDPTPPPVLVQVPPSHPRNSGRAVPGRSAADRFFDVLDPKFEKRVAPFVIRFIWVLALAATAGEILVLVGLHVFGFIGTVQEMFNEESTTSAVEGVTYTTIGLIAFDAFFIFYATISLLIVRVGLESIMTLFSIHSHLESISNRSEHS